MIMTHVWAASQEGPLVDDVWIDNFSAGKLDLAQARGTAIGPGIELVTGRFR